VRSFRAAARLQVQRSGAFAPAAAEYRSARPRTITPELRRRRQIGLPRKVGRLVEAVALQYGANHRVLDCGDAVDVLDLRITEAIAVIDGRAQSQRAQIQVFVTEALAGEVLSLPMWPVMPDSYIDRIAAAVGKVLA